MSFLLKWLKKPAATIMNRTRAQEISLKNKGLGPTGEELACEYLIEKGFKLLERNFSCPGGEIDIIAIKDDIIHFVEVKSRSQRSLESPLEAVTATKMKRVRKAAEIWLCRARKKMRGVDEKVCYLSVVGVEVVGGSARIALIEDAFS